MADAVVLTSNWEQLQDRFYRKKEIYNMFWTEHKMDLNKYVCVAAPYGGPVAMMIDETKFVKVTSGIAPSQIQIFTSSGKRLAAFVLKKSQARLVRLGWTEHEELVAILDDGHAHLYTVFGELIREFGLGADCQNAGIADCQIFGLGFVVLTNKYEFVWFASFEEPRPRLLANAGITSAPKSWAIIEPRYSLSNTVEVLVATSSGTILVVDGDNAQDQLLENGPFECISVAPGGKFVACFSSTTNNLWVTTSDLQRTITTFDTKSARVPNQLVWCGTDSVVLAWPSLLLMVGPSAAWIKYPFDEPTFLAPEADGVRVFTNTVCEFLERVPDVIEQIFKIGSLAPSAMLFDAAEHYSRGSPKADELLREIGDDLSAAVSACIAAAGCEWQAGAQRALLRAASFGKPFCSDHALADEFVRMARDLRVLNAVRHCDVGVPLTHAQYVALAPRTLVARLTGRHEHLLALRIAQHCSLRPDDVLTHWAARKALRDDGSDDALGAQIVAKMSLVPGISYAKVAAAAYRGGKRALATLLLDHEPRAADQVPLLIGMKEDELALRKAIASGDTDLVYLALLHVKRTLAPAQFFAMLRDKPVAMDLLVAYSKQQDLALLKDIYFAANKPHESAHIAVREAYAKRDLSERVRGLQSALNIYREAKDSFHATQTEDQIRLLLLQKEIEAESGDSLVGLPLSDTLAKCLSINQHKRAALLVKEFKVPERRFWHLRVAVAGRTHDWELLESIAKEKKSPIGYEPFVSACLANAAPVVETRKYIAKISDAATRCENYIRIEALREAATAAKEAKSNELLERVASLAPNDRQLQAHIESLVAAK